VNAIHWAIVIGATVEKSQFSALQPTKVASFPIIGFPRIASQYSCAGIKHNRRRIG
jgi:hypothetical protein